MEVVPDAGLLVATAAASLLYVRGWRRRPSDGAAARRGGEVAAFAGGLLVLLLALSPTFEHLAARSFAWHMVQHQLLILAAAPLIVTARPLLTARWAAARGTASHASGRRQRRAGGSEHRTGGLEDRAGGLERRAGGSEHRADWLERRAGWLALGAGVLHLLTVLTWHLPPMYDAAMADLRLHHLEHVSLFATAVLAWGAILTAARDRGIRALAAVIGLALNALAGAGLGVVLLSAPLPLYGWYADLGAVALDQQRVGGALMKVSAVVVYAGTAALIVMRWLHRLAAEPDATTDLTTLDGQIAVRTPAEPWTPP